MLRTSLLLGLAAIATGSLAAPSFGSSGSSIHVVHERRNERSFEWDKRSRADAAYVLPVRVGLKERNLEHGHFHLMDVSDPSSKNYGKHWTAEEVADFFAPSDESRDAVTEWMTDNGIERERITYSKGRNWVEVNATVEEAEKLFLTDFHYFEHKETGGWRIACDHYHLPKDIQRHVDFAMPTIQLDGLKPVANLHPALAEERENGGLTGLKNCSNLITVECLRALYKFPAGSTANPTNAMGIGEWADYLYDPDLPIYFKNYTTQPIPSDTVPEFISIDGGRRSNKSVAEAEEVIESALDFQTAYSIVYPQKLRLYQVGDGVNVDSVGTFNIFLDALDASYCTYEGGDAPYVDPEYPDPNIGGYTGPLQCGGAPKSNVFSFSYNQIEGALPEFYQRRQCHEWMKLGMQGVSVFFASGDSGVANRYNSGYLNSCLNADQLYVDTNGTRYSPSFPCNCPYVTVVGATTLKGATIAEGEVAVAQPNKTQPKLDYYSGGGFSNIFTLPSYQKSAVTNYLTKYKPDLPAGVYNNSGNSRAYPDVAAIGLHVATVYLGKTIAVGGTSASTPIVASIVTLLNEARLAANKKPVGFVNPVFYAHPEAFNDIVEGSNPGCGSAGFKCQPGWDPVTGLGTPNFKKLKDIFMSLP